MRPSTVLCRLCICYRTEFLMLVDNNGQNTETFNIASQYFDSKYLATTLCTECWHHIYGFHTFQKSVIEAQNNFENVEILHQLDEEVLLDKVCDEMLNDDINLTETDLSFIEDTNDCSSSNNEHFLNDSYTDAAKEIQDLEIEILNCTPKPTEESIDYKPNSNFEDCTLVLNYDFSQNTKLNFYDDYNLFSQDDDLSQSTEPNPQKENIEIMQKIEPVIIHPSQQQIALQQDAFIAEWKQDLECDICKYRFLNFTLLNLHFKQQHPSITRSYIICCNNKLFSRSNIVDHISVHLNPNSFECKICGKCFVMRRNLKWHMRNAHGENAKKRPFECSVCAKGFPCKSQLRIHSDVHRAEKDHICKTCNKGFVNKQRLRKHQHNVHNTKHLCDQCGKSVHDIYALKEHLLEHAGIEKPKVPCDICGAQLKSRINLYQHKRLSHPEGSTVYNCSECGKKYYSKHTLKMHKNNVHDNKSANNERKFKCIVCNKGFRYAQRLREHTATHTGEVLHQCSHCSKMFKYGSNLYRHIKKLHQTKFPS